MFNSIDLNERYNYYLTVKKSPSKVGKTVGIIGTAFYVLIALAVVFSADELTSGNIVFLIVFLLVTSFIFVETGKNCTWAYYWELERSGDRIGAIAKLIYFGVVIEFFLRIKYHNFEKRIRKEYSQQG